MEEKKENSELSCIELDNSTKEIANSIIQETDINKVKDLTHLFNLNQAKKNTIRIMKLNQLMDTVSDKIIERFEKRPDEFNNKDLLDYLQVTQSAIERAEKSLNQIDESTSFISVHNTQNDITVNIVDDFDRDSKEKIMAAVQALIQKSESLEKDVTVEAEEIKPEEENNI